TDFFKGDNQAVSISSNTKRALNLSVLAQDRSFITKINTFPINTEIKTIKTYTATPSIGGVSIPGIPGAPSSIQAANEAGAVTVELNTS
ncbi:DUF5117 domain-containing protein, partial [Shewanella algae]|uniref:DUF5117 domain-containing protein n=1 Tax=Shewanella algae TaxID=38313 RepID=UPI00313E1C83